MYRHCHWIRGSHRGLTPIFVIGVGDRIWLSIFREGVRFVEINITYYIKNMLPTLPYSAETYALYSRHKEPFKNYLLAFLLLFIVLIYIFIYYNIFLLFIYFTTNFSADYYYYYYHFNASYQPYMDHKSYYWHFNV